jgi:hypothetical protein
MSKFYHMLVAEVDDNGQDKFIASFSSYDPMVCAKDAIAFALERRQQEQTDRHASLRESMRSPDFSEPAKEFAEERMQRDRDELARLPAEASALLVRILDFTRLNRDYKYARELKSNEEWGWIEFYLVELVLPPPPPPPPAPAPAPTTSN